MSMRWTATLLMALCGLAACEPQIYERADGASRQGSGMNRESQLAARLDELEQQAGGRLLRVILTVADAEDGGTGAMDAVQAALREAGAYSVEPIEGTAFLVVEAELEALRAATRTGLIAGIALDDLSPPSH
jgi:hypothetical protein